MIVDIMEPKEEARGPSFNETSHIDEKEDPMVFETMIKVLCIARIQRRHRLSLPLAQQRVPGEAVDDRPWVL